MLYVLSIILCVVLLLAGLLYLMKSVNATITAIVIGLIIIGFGSTFIDSNAGTSLMKTGAFICAVLIAIGIGKMIIKK